MNKKKFAILNEAKRKKKKIKSNENGKMISKECEQETGNGSKQQQLEGHEIKKRSREKEIYTNAPKKKGAQ